MKTATAICAAILTLVAVGCAGTGDGRPNEADAADHREIDEGLPAADDTDLDRTLPEVLVGAQAVVTGRVAIRDSDPDPHPGQELFFADLTIDEVTLAVDRATNNRPERATGDLDLQAGVVPVYLPIDNVQVDEIAKLIEGPDQLFFVLYYHNLSSAEWSPWQINAIARQDSDGSIEIVHPWPAAALSDDLSAAFGARPELSDLASLVDELRQSLAAAESDGIDRSAGPLERAINDARAPQDVAETSNDDDVWRASPSRDRSLLDGVAPDEVLDSLKQASLAVQIPSDVADAGWAIRLYNDVGLVHYFQGDVGSHYIGIYLPEGSSELRAEVEGVVRGKGWPGDMATIRVTSGSELVFDLGEWLSDPSIDIETPAAYANRTGVAPQFGEADFLLNPPAGQPVSAEDE